MTQPANKASNSQVFTDVDYSTPQMQVFTDVDYSSKTLADKVSNFFKGLLARLRALFTCCGAGVGMAVLSAMKINDSSRKLTAKPMPEEPIFVAALMLKKEAVAQ